MGPTGLGITFLTLPLVVRAAAGGQWCYDSQDPRCGPSHWKELKATCGGDRQSPVNIDRRRLQRDAGLGDILFEGYDQAPPGKWRLTNNGHTVMLSLAGESASEHIAVSGGGLPGRFRALQLHFHWGSPAGNGSEHTLDGRQLPMEMHIVHMNAKYQTLAEAKVHPNGLAVLGFFFQVSETTNTNYNTIVAGLRNVSHAAQGIRQHPALPTRGIHAPENDQQLPPAAAAPQPEDLCLPGGHSQRGLPARGPPPDALTPAPPGPAQPLLSSPVGSGPAAAEVEVMRLARGKWETRKTKHLETLAG
ncbi:carbonic anhydrase 15-like isoform 2-T2 [Geothlypis trichas]